MHYAPRGWKDLSEGNLRRNLPFLSWNNVSQPMNDAFGPKSAVIPERVKRMDVYVVSEFYNKTIKQKVVDSKTEARFHHFKNDSVWGEIVLTVEHTNYTLAEPTVFFNSSLTDKWIKNIMFTLRQVYGWPKITGERREEKLKSYENFNDSLEDRRRT